MCWNADAPYSMVTFSFFIRKSQNGDAIATYKFNEYTSRGWKYGILDVSGITGDYYIVFTSGYYRSNGSNIACATYVNQIFLSVT